MGNYSDCWELSSFSPGERLSPKLAVANRKIVGNSKPQSWYGSTFGLSRRGRLYLLKNPAVTHAGGIFLSSALPAEPECWSWCPIWFQEKLFRNNFSLIRFSWCWLFQQLSIIWFGNIVGNCSGCWWRNCVFTPATDISEECFDEKNAVADKAKGC